MMGRRSVVGNLSVILDVSRVVVLIFSRMPSPVQLGHLLP